MDRSGMEKPQRVELPRGVKRGDEIEVEITGVTDRGLGRGTVEAVVGPQREEKNYEFFVRKALPGDRVRVHVEKTRRKRCTGRWVEMIQESPLRRPARCPHFGRREVSGRGCGGCTFQSVSYRHQLAIKERMVKDHFKDHGLDTGYVLPVLGMEEPWYYRNKMEFSFGDDGDREFALGMHPTGYRHEVLNLEQCFLMSEFVGEFLPRIRQWCRDQGLKHYRAGSKTREESGFLRTLTIREGKRTGERLVNLMTTGEDRGDVVRGFSEAARGIAEDLGEPLTSVYWTQMTARKGSPTTWTDHLIFGEEVLNEELRLPGGRSLRFEIHPRAFFQPNTLGAELLYGQVLEKAGLGVGSDARILDLYCGTGTIGLCLAPFSRHVVGVELQKDAVLNARKNAAFNGIDNVEFFAGDVGALLKSGELGAIVDEIDLIVVDPPRSGLFDEAIEEILSLGAERLVYVSCNPKTLAKNLVDLKAGGYEVEVVQPVDLFPHTFHVEHVALLGRPQRA